MMSNSRTLHQQRVDEFMLKLRSFSSLAPLVDTPHIPIPSLILSRSKLILEEVFELLEVCGVGVYVNCVGGRICVDRETFKVILNRLPFDEELPEIAKELADCSVVITGTFSEFGISDDSILEETDNNNLGKFGVGGFLDANHKWNKPPDHPKPDIASLLKKQGWNPEVINYEPDEDALRVSCSNNGQKK